MIDAMSIDEILKTIDDAIAPPLSKQQAYKLLDELADAIDARMDALREDMRGKK